MNKLGKEELKKINGGAGMTAAMLNAMIRAVSTMFTVGQAIGSAIRRATGRNYCWPKKSGKQKLPDF